MPGLQLLACLGAVLLTQTGCVCDDTQFLESHEGGSVTLPCALEQRNSSPIGVYLRRTWLRPGTVLFKLTQSEFTTDNDGDKTRISTSGDPSRLSVNVTISQLSASDTDRYFCEFVVDNPSSVDDQVPGKTEFFLLVNGDAPGSVDVGLVETCAGGSAVLPCLTSNGEGLAVEGVSLKRRRGRAPVEMLYHSKRHHGSSSPFASSSSSQFPAEKVQLTSAPGPGGITFNLTLQQLQPDDSGLYSCQLLLRGRPDGSTGLGRQVFFLSVQAQCGCSSYSTLLYALSSAVAVLLLLLLVSVVMCKVAVKHVTVTTRLSEVKSRRRVTTHSQSPIYEEMAGVQTASRKLPQCHQEEMEPSEYRNCPVKKSCPENHYESPRSALCPRRESEIKY